MSGNSFKYGTVDDGKYFTNRKDEIEKFHSILESEKSPLTNGVRNSFMLGATSTVLSALKKLIQKGFVIQIEHAYDIEDPFLKFWILKKRKQ
ncbi:MAG: hypothetical protein KDC88_15680 [Ignavibacteriae bacterium]|nr:hypothetical protein [Ignavibacteriota bacterium]